MNHAIRYEIARLTSVRSTWMLLGAALGLQLLVAFLYASHSDMTPRQQFVGAYSGITLLAVTMCTTAIAVHAFGHEYRYGTITTTVLTLRRRGWVLTAKLLTTAAIAAGTAALGVGSTLLALQVRSALPSETWRVGEVFVAVVGYATLSAVVGAAVAALCRNATLAMVVVLGFPAVVEMAAMLIGVNPNILPFSAAARTVQLDSGTMVPLAALAAVLTAAGAVAFARRDV